MRALFGRLLGRNTPPVPAPTPTPTPTPESQAAHLQAGNAALAAGDLAAAGKHYRAAVRQAPGDAMAHLNLGYVLLEQGQLDVARDSLEKAVALGGGADAHYLLGQAHAARGDWAEARASHRRAVDARADFGFAWKDLGVACEQLGDAPAALDAYERASRHAPDLVDALGGRARMLLQLGRHADALQSARAWSERAPEDWSAHFVHAQALQALGHDAEALPVLDRAQQLAPGHAYVAYTRANGLFRLQRFAEAAEAYAQAVAAAPEWADAWANHAVALDRLKRYDEAIASLDRALGLEPAHRNALYMRSMLLLYAQREPEALASLERLKAAYPGDARVEWDYGFGHLLAGRMQEGWPAFEARWRTADIGVALQRHPFREPLWTGQPLRGKSILLYPEQGYGDVLQFIRFVPALEQAGARVLVWVPEPLVGLVATVSPNCVVGSKLEALPPFDFQCPIMSLPLALGTTLETLPAAVPYLHADAQRRSAWAGQLGPRRGLRVGVVWSGNPAQKNDHNRSMPLAQFRGLAVPGVEFVSLLNVVQPRDQAALREWRELRHFGEDLKTFSDSAALAAEMDLVITVCTSGAHLAGALGLPTWVLLAQRADWRWLLHREDSPWYPSARLFRQDGTGDWAPVIARVREELARRAAS
ncbi:tetratricopeptide repeat protein [Ramlibacter sp. G-1-2-2]|uniref:Tetratricopeptide repeat protein n=1 Tax=Ramlibacter agri TaxID=2728837 RepID=A0A848GX12_9BURK|nr:tetratricopeptide repeat protein [Ramlibacter agri]NML42687.1 tetratricopeptide repeat protein [Ramlibacter agri]